MTIDVTGVPGSVETLWILAGEGTAIANSLIHTDTNNHFAGDSALLRAVGQAGGNYINDGSFDWGIQFIGSWSNTSGTDPIFANDVLIQPRVKVGSTIRSIFSIAYRDRFLFDSFGIRVTPTTLRYFIGDVAELSGAFTLPVDISNFVPGLYRNLDGANESTGLEFTGAGEFQLRIQGQTTSSDFGDAPFSYHTLLADDGARHVPVGPVLGVIRDAELNGFASANADGDDQVGAPDDEDGITTVPQAGFDRNGGVSNAVLLTLLNAPADYEIWIDWNIDGVFSDPGELAASGTLTTDGQHTIPVALPGSAIVGTTFIRARVYTPGQSLGTPNGLASSGEVEDYAVELQDTTLLDLLSFDARVTHQQTVELSWRTGSETNVAGFNIWQESMESSGFTDKSRVNSELIPSNGSGLLGAEYRLSHDPGYGVFTFELEELETSGFRVSHGNVTVSLRPEVQIIATEVNTLEFRVVPKMNWDYHLESALLGTSGPFNWGSANVSFGEEGVALVSRVLSEDRVFRVVAISSE